MRSETVDDDSEVVDDHGLHGEDNVLPHVPDVQPDVPDVENKIDEEDDVKGHGGQDSQEVDVKVSKAEATYFSMRHADQERMAELMARKVVAIQNEAKERKESKEKLEETWDEGTDYLSCRVCVIYKDHHQVPQHLHRMRKKNFGFIGKQGKDGKD